MTQLEEGFVLIGWIAFGMDVSSYDNYSHKYVRSPPKIYKTEGVANRYGVARPVYIKENK
jgi:hypothetical protein